MLRKRLMICAVISAILAGTITVAADEPCDYEYFIDNILSLRQQLGGETKENEIPEEYNSYSKTLTEAASNGVVSFDELDALTGIVTKQDAMRIVYEMLTQLDPQFEITDEEARELLNDCYDNAYLKDENKKAYASMIRHGIIGTRGLTEPDKVLTKESLEVLKGRVSGLFEKKLPVMIGGRKIYIGSSVNEVENIFGEPDRIDNNKYGFQWYVYNSQYSNFIMIGIHDDVVCAYFTNASSFEFDGLIRGCAAPYTPHSDGLKILRDADGYVNGVLYNPFEINENAEVDNGSEFLELCDMINSYRSAENLLTYVFPSIGALTAFPPQDSKVCEVELSGDCFENYNYLLSSSSLFINYDGTNSCIPIFAQNKFTLFDTGKSVLNVLRSNSKYDEEVGGEIKSIKTPELISPTAQQLYDEDVLELKLSKRCANKYFVKVYNLETEKYDVYAYLDSKLPVIKIPSYMLTKGNKYRVCVSSVAGDEILVGNTVEFTYGVCETPVVLQSPANGLSTYDDEIEISVSSEAYHDFRIDVYNSKGELALTKNMSGINQMNLESLPADKYSVYATAISHALGTEVGCAQASVEIKSFSPVIKEYILEPNEKFNFYYGDEKDWLYFYDCETIAVTKNSVKVIQSEDIGVQTEAEETAEEFEKQEKLAKEEKTAEPLKKSISLKSAEQTEKTNGEKKTDNDKKSDFEKKAETVKVEAENKSEEVQPTAAAEIAVGEKNEEMKDDITVEHSDAAETSKPTSVKKEEVVVPVTVYKKKITQRKVPATKKYRALAALIPKNTFTSGSFIESHITQPTSQKGSAIAAMALSYQGVPYVWGGASPTGFDCSGLVKYVCNSLGIKDVARTSAVQFASSGVFVDRSQLQPGDFVYFQKNGTVHHVGIYIGNNMMVHAPHTGDVVKVSSLSEPYYMKEYAGAKRVY